MSRNNHLQNDLPTLTLERYKFLFDEQGLTNKRVASIYGITTQELENKIRNIIKNNDEMMEKSPEWEPKEIDFLRRCYNTPSHVLAKALGRSTEDVSNVKIHILTDEERHELWRLKDERKESNYL